MESEIEELRTKLKESEAQKVAIAGLAKEILEKDKDKDRRLSALGEENLQQSRDIARLQALLKTRDEYLADAENEVGKLRNVIAEMNDNKSAYMVELEQKLSSLRAQVTEKNGIVSEQEQELQELKKKLAAKERELGEALKNPPGEVPLNQTRDSFTDSERLKLNGRVAELESERDLILDEISQLQDRIAIMNRDLDNERSHVEELTVICNGYKNDIGELRQRTNELTSELNEYRSNTKMAKKGNSMFFEFVDERVKLEKDLLKLKAQNDFFASQKEAYESELNEMRHELMLALTLRAGDGSEGGDTSILQQEIYRLRNELAAVNAKLLEKCKEGVQVEPVNTSYTLQTVDLKERAFNNLNEEVRTLTRKLDSARKDRAEYFDKFRECEARYGEECKRSRELMNEVTCLKKRLTMEQKKNANTAASRILKPSKEKLSEKIADINKIDAGDPTISSLSLSNYSLTSAKRAPLLPVREEDATETTLEVTVDSAEVTAVAETSSVGPALAGGNENGVPLPLLELNAKNEKEMPVEKRLKFQLSNEMSWSSMAGRINEDVYPVKRKPKRKIMKKVCEANNL